MRINVNLNDIESGFELYPDGTHVVEIQPTSKIKAGDSPYIQVIAKCTEGEMEDKLIGWTCSLLPQSLWFLQGMLKAIDVEWDEEGFELEDIFEKSVMIDVSTREFTRPGADEAEPRNQVDGFHAV